MILELYDLFKPLDKNMPVQRMGMLLAIALEKRITMGELAKKLKISQSTVWRNVAILSDKGWTSNTNVKPTNGLGLISIRTDPDFPRRKIISLTSKGKRLAEEISQVLIS